MCFRRDFSLFVQSVCFLLYRIYVTIELLCKYINEVSTKVDGGCVLVQKVTNNKTGIEKSYKEVEQKK